ncbi:Phorbol ester/diacylglycerol-binding protein unc-13 [Dufourea novaeangliae]|uniref:Phorbol ester/diacylglycerol-binding protein unc-13 n=1 Tax=Dufourea novaeangliae TaxID=178035 RepID=A0A154PEA5_DUFNO|nr:Phorbol ester/diacylglycerol-binding protein unc-13 [Dufourea novaeangliae]
MLPRPGRVDDNNIDTDTVATDLLRTSSRVALALPLTFPYYYYYCCPRAGRIVADAVLKSDRLIDDHEVVPLSGIARIVTPRPETTSPTVAAASTESEEQQDASDREQETVNAAKGTEKKLETNDMNTGLLVEVWCKGFLWDRFLGYYYVPLTEVSYMNEEGSAQWVSLDSELEMRGAEIIGTKKPTGHSLLIDCRLDLPFGKCEQRTRWKALLTSETAMQLRAARPMCGSGTLVKILGPDRRTVLISGTSLISRSSFRLISWFFLTNASDSLSLFLSTSLWISCGSYDRDFTV